MEAKDEAMGGGRGRGEEKEKEEISLFVPPQLGQSPHHTHERQLAPMPPTGTQRNVYM